MQIDTAWLKFDIQGIFRSIVIIFDSGLVMQKKGLTKKGVKQFSWQLHKLFFLGR